MPHPVVHWEIAAKDANKAREFYANLFGWQFDTTNPDYAMLAAQDGGIGGGIMQTPDQAPPYVTIYVSVEDLAATLARAGSLGATTIVPPTPIEGVGSFAMFSDPEGRVIGLLQPQR
jgi:predicted enzyme related to lactoylglutathione lyase